MGSTPDIVNDRGEIFDANIAKQIFGDTDYNLSHYNEIRGSGGRALQGRAKELFDNWMHGVRAAVLDPTDSLSRDNAVKPMRDLFAMGSGISGLFGFGTAGSVPGAATPLQPLNQGPMAPGVPYSAPPIKPIE